MVTQPFFPYVTKLIWLLLLFYCCDKRSLPRKLTEGRAYLWLTVPEGWVHLHHNGKVLQQAGVMLTRQLMPQSSHFKRKSESVLAMAQSFWNIKMCLCWHTPGQSHHLDLPQTTKNWDQVFKYLRFVGGISFKPEQFRDINEVTVS